MPAAELAATHPVPRGMASSWHVRPPLLVALALSLLLHLAWSLWPIEFTPATVLEEPPLTATLKVMPPPPQAAPTPQTPAPVAEHTPPPKVRVSRKPRHPAPRTPVITTQKRSIETETRPSPTETATATAANAPAANESATSLANVVIGPPAPESKPTAVLPPRLDLAYKVYFGTQGFMIGTATYRFEHDGDRYRISTVVEPRGLAALFVHGRGLVESRGIITPDGLKPYEFVIERGSADKREVAYFDWDAGSVVLKGGKLDALEPPAFDPLTIMWQPYFSPPSREDQTFSLATTRQVARYTLSLQGEEMLVWQGGEVLTQRWHEVSDDRRAEGWFWLAPSMHYIPIKIRVARTERGTLEAVLDAIRTDANGATISDAEQRAEDNAPFKPSMPMMPEPGGAESHGQ